MKSLFRGDWKKANLTKDQKYPDTLGYSSLLDIAINKNILIFKNLLLLIGGLI